MQILFQDQDPVSVFKAIEANLSGRQLGSWSYSPDDKDLRVEIKN